MITWRWGAWRTHRPLQSVTSLDINHTKGECWQMGVLREWKRWFAARGVEESRDECWVLTPLAFITEQLLFVGGRVRPRCAWCIAAITTREFGGDFDEQQKESKGPVKKVEGVGRSSYITERWGWVQHALLWRMPEIFKRTVRQFNKDFLHWRPPTSTIWVNRKKRALC